MAILRSTQIKGNLSVEQNLTVDGNLNVQGDLTYIGVNNLRVKDKQIELNATDSGSAIVGTANEAGIVIRGARKTENVVDDASILYDNSDDTLVVNKTIKGTVSNATTATTATSADKVANKLTVNVKKKVGSGEETEAVVFDGSAAKTVNIDLKALQDQIDGMSGDVGSIATQINDAINNLDSTLPVIATGTAQKGGVFVLQEVTIKETAGKLDTEQSQLTAVEVEKAGAAAAAKTELIGKDSDTADSATIKGAKKYADSLAGNYAAASHKHEISDVNGLQTALDGKAAADHTHTNYDAHLADTVKHITAEERTAWNAKQNALTETQLAAANSGITSAKVSDYDAHVANNDIHVTADDKTKWNGIEQKAKTYTDDEIKKLGTAAKSNVLTGKIADSSSSNDLVTAAQVKTYADGLNTTMDGRVAKLEAIDHKKLADDASADAVAKVVAGAPSDFDTLKEVADWIKNDKTGAAGLQTDVAGLKTDVAGLKTDVSTLESASHTHDNKAELDKIADGDKAKWDGHVADKVMHITAGERTAWNAKQDALSNANVLKAITDTQVSNWNDAATKAHVHDNKTVLDDITAEKVAAWDGAVSAAGVSSVGGKAGALTLKGGSATLGDVNLSISDTGEISAAIVPDSFDVKGAAAKALTDAKTYVDGKVDGKFDAAGAAAAVKSDVIGVNGDAADKDTIYGAKAYADAAVNALSGSVAATDAAQNTEITKIKSDIANITNGTALDNRYVNADGDTMTGELTMSATNIRMPENGTNGIIFGNMKIVWNSANGGAIEFIPA